jgi:hypothetical protein
MHTASTQFVAMFCVSCPTAIVTAALLPFLPLGVAALFGVVAAAMVVKEAT